MADFHLQSTMKKIAIFISGRGSNMEAIIRETENGILYGMVEIILIFSNNPEAKGLESAKVKGLKTHSIVSKGKVREDFDDEVIEYLKQYEFDYIVLAGYMRILSKNFITTYPHKIINIHPADTKLHQGTHGYDWAFKKKLKETKITIHYVNENLDTGEIIAQTTVDLKGAVTIDEVEKRGLAVEHKFYPETLKNLFTE
jgi:phosphoribosylglycinamide formyltransferase-1